MSSKVFYSNRLETLLGFLKTEIQPSKPFQRQTLIVPSEAMKQWVYLGLASQDSQSVAMGFEVAYLSQTLKRLGAKGYIPSKWDLSFAIEKELRAVLDGEGDDGLWKPLRDYFLRSNERQREERLVSVSHYLASAFKQYSVYAYEHIVDWDQQEAEHWQQALWKKLYTSQAKWCHEGKLMEQLVDNLPVVDRDQHLHLFAFSCIPKRYWQCLARLSEHCSLSVYLLSPCQAFWTDIRSDRECLRLQDYWRWRGAQQGQLADLELFLSDRNPLLANFGRLGREMAELLELSDSQSYELYRLPDSIAELDQYQESLPAEHVQLAESAADLSLLEAVQSDLLLMRNPDQAQPIDFSADDASFQVHVFPSRYREVQGLYDTLLTILGQDGVDGQAIHPSDVVVMTPDLSEYQAYIDAVFGAENSQLPYAFLEMPLQMRSSLVQGFLHLLDIAKGRWELKQVLELFEYPAFRRRHRITSDELATYKRWLLKAGVRWGESLEHRIELLQKDHVAEGIDPNDHSGTWDFGFRRLLDGLVMSIPREQSCPDVPVEGIELGQAELLGRLEGLFRSVRSDLRFLEEQKELAVEQWCQYLRCLLEAYFQVDDQDYCEQHDRSLLLKHLDILQRSAAATVDGNFPFSSIERRLRLALQEETASQNESRLESVRFCSLLPMRAVPAKVVVLLGLDDAAYPRKEEVQSLNLLKTWRDADYSPSRIDFDRYLFLEAILSARQYLLFSYQCRGDDKQAAPSLLVSEMLSYLDRAYRIAGRKPSESLVYRHPMHPFDALYFSERNRWISSHSPDRFRMAQAYQLEEKREAHRFQQRRLQAPSLDDPRVITVRDLAMTAKNPMQRYFRKSLDLRIDDMELAQDPSEDPFHLNRILRSYLRREGTLRTATEVMDRARSQGLRPVGPFGDLAEQLIAEEVEEYKAVLDAWGLDSKDLFDIELSARCEQAEEQADGSWVLPAVTVNIEGKGLCSIVGKLQLVSPVGLLTWGSDDISDVWRVWPEYLIFCLSAPQIPKIQKLRLLALKSGKILPELFAPAEDLLKEFVLYSMRCTEELCPLLAEWLSKILKQEDSFLQKDVREYWNSSQVYFFNQYAKWSLDSSEPLLFRDLLEGWDSTVDQLIRPLASAWFPKLMRGTHV